METQKTLTVHCGRCQHEWHAALPLPMLLSRAIARMDAVVAEGCPVCGSSGPYVLCGPTHPPRTEPPGFTLVCQP
jgi:hypothetical protein